MIIKQKIIVLICDGDVNYKQATIDRCIAGGIQIYAVNVGYAPSHVSLKKMADQTGGEYYYAASTDQIEAAFAEIIGDTTGQIDPTDADGDGLYDIFETAGMKLANGRIIYTDPANPDTDGDGLTDYQETGIVYNVDDRYIGSGHFINVKYFTMRSYPDQTDSDGDGLTDDVDDRPLMADMVEIARLNSKFSNYYLNIVGSDGTTYCGGDQGWWADKTPYQPSTDKSEELLKKIEDKYYRLWQMGCGVIAMCDAELYLTLQNSNYNLRVSNTFDADFQTTGLCKKDAYRDYIEQMYKYKYPIIDVNIGLYPSNMEGGFTNFLMTNHIFDKKVKWARYCFESNYKQKQDILTEVECMLNADMPVVFSYHTFTKGDNIILYNSIQGAQNSAGVNEDGTTPQKPSSHYMTIIGLYKCPAEQPWNYKHILEVVSWGQVYYIDYDMYSGKLDYFSNILSVY